MKSVYIILWGAPAHYNAHREQYVFCELRLRNEGNKKSETSRRPRLIRRIGGAGYSLSGTQPEGQLFLSRVCTDECTRRPFG